MVSACARRKQIAVSHELTIVVELLDDERKSVPVAALRVEVEIPGEHVGEGDRERRSFAESAHAREKIVVEFAANRDRASCELDFFGLRLPTELGACQRDPSQRSAMDLDPARRP